jgi:hypothetical protein
MIFDKWFVRCCKNPFIVARAWSLVATLRSNKYGYYANLVLCKNREIRYKFAELCACIYKDTHIETSTWKFSIHNLEEENKNIMTITKKDIQNHETRKTNLYNFFRSENVVIQHPSSPLVLTSVVFGSHSHYRDLSLDAYNSLVNKCIASIGSDPLKPGFNSADNSEDIDWDPRYKLSVYERGASCQMLGDPSETWMFHTDEIDVLRDLDKILDNNNTTNMDIIIKDPFMSILFATAVGYSYRIRHARGSMMHIPISMQVRINNSKASVEIQLASAYSRVVKASKNRNLN